MSKGEDQEFKGKIYGLLEKDEHVHQLICSIVSHQQLISTQTNDAEISNLKDELEKLRGKYSGIEGELNSKDAEIRKIGDELSKCKKNISEIISERNRIYDELKICQAEYKNSKIQLNDKNLETEKLKNELAENKKTISLINADRNRISCELKEWQSEYRNIKTQLKNKDAEIENLKGELAEYKKNVNAIAAEKDHILDECEKLKRKYGSLDELDKIYKVYNVLPQNIRTSMNGFIRGDSLLAFVTSGARDTKLEAFWEFCRAEVQKSNGLEYAKEIAAVFTFFFAKIMSATDDPLYRLDISLDGMEFDDDKMILSNSSAVRSGVVDTTVLPGFTGINSGRIAKKAIVILKGNGK